jgi:hypothetical protein
VENIQSIEIFQYKNTPSIGIVQSKIFSQKEYASRKYSASRDIRVQNIQSKGINIPVQNTQSVGVFQCKIFIQ